MFVVCMQQNIFSKYKIIYFSLYVALKKYWLSKYIVLDI